MLNIQAPPGLKKVSYYDNYNSNTEQMIIGSIDKIVDLTKYDYEYIYDQETSKNILFSINSIFKEDFIGKPESKIHPRSNTRSKQRLQSKYLKNKSSNSLNQIIFYKKNFHKTKYLDKKNT